MTTIQNATQQIAAALRLQITALGKAAQLAKSKARKLNAEPQSEEMQPEPDLADRIALQLQGIAANDPLFKRKVLRIFLESVISAELGVSLANDVRFATMIDSVQKQMEADAELSMMIDSALITLVQSKKLE